jgi:hypothetical protein
MAKYMKDHAYRAPPLRAEIIKQRTAGDEKIFVVKILFPAAKPRAC